MICESTDEEDNWDFAVATTDPGGPSAGPSSSSSPRDRPFPTPAWATVAVGGKRKRQCEWTNSDGTACGACVGDTKQKMEAHWRTHTGEKPHTCGHCDKAFANSGDRDKHERTHTGEKPFKCSHEGCDKAFATSGTRDRHERTHTGEKPFKCSHEGCDKAFVTSGNRDSHERTHTGERPYACSHEGCHKAFANSSTRDAHERTHRGEKSHPCKGGKAGVCANNYNGMPKYDGRCVQCFIDAFPNDVRAVHAKTHLHAKEQAVRLFLEQAFPEYRWVFDRSHAVGVLQRPDAKVSLCKTRVLIVEVDEHSHNTYDCAKEREREAILAKHAPKDAVIHLIRFNPDAYDDPVTGVRVPSCFRYSKALGLTTVDPKRQADWDARLARLRDVICEIAAHKHEAIAVPACLLADDRYGHVVPIELFYDNVREKWPDGHAQRRDALKRNAKVRKLLLLAPSEDNEDNEDEDENENETLDLDAACVPCDE